MRWAPLVLFLIFAAAIAGRILLHWRTNGVSPYVLPNDDSPEGYIARALRWVGVGFLTGLIGEAIGLGSWIGVLPWARQPVAFWPGVVLVAAALLLVVVAQAQMGSSWRIGIDHEDATPLIDRGLFGISRNPIFLGTRIALLGALLLIPNAVVFATVLAAEVLIQMETRLEERHLIAMHGEAYNAYARRVHRWLGRRRIS